VAGARHAPPLLRAELQADLLPERLHYDPLQRTPISAEEKDRLVLEKRLQADQRRNTQPVRIACLI
jgi:hypothetical protein